MGLIFLGGPALADPVDQWAAHIAEASSRFGIPAQWVRRVMRIESGGRTMIAGRPVVSRAGAMGLMQLMPGTWRDMRMALKLGLDPFDPHDNIVAGAAYLRLMYDRFGYPGLFAAYHAGPARYRASLATGRPLAAATRAYVAAATAQRSAAALNPKRHPIAPLFAQTGGGAHRSSTSDSRSAMGTPELFVSLRGQPAE